MLYREQTVGFSLKKVFLRLPSLFDARQRRRRRVEMDLMSLSPYLRRDIGFDERRPVNLPPCTGEETGTAGFGDPTGGRAQQQVAPSRPEGQKSAFPGGAGGRGRRT